MGTPVTESFNALRMTASGTIKSDRVEFGGFFCTEPGTLQLRAGPDVTDAIAVGSFAVAEGVYYPLPFSFGAGAYAELGGGAQGTFAYL